MTTRHPRPPKAPRPTPEQTMILLRGPLAPFNPDTAPAARAAAVRLAANDDGLRLAAALWDQHATYLRWEAAKLSVKPAFKARGGGPLLFWAEAFAIRLRAHGARQRAHTR